jgi:hypothetical protein
LYRYNGSAFVSSIAAGDITGTIGSDVFPNNLRPVEVVSTLPTSGNFQGRQVFLTSDNKLYRYNGTSFIASVATSDLQGQVSSTQISDNSISTAKIQADAITANEIATGAVTADAITAGSISSAAIAADAITSNKIAANAVTAGAIQAGAVSADALAANVITSDKIAAGAIQTSDLAANSITGGLIAASGVITNSAQIDNLVVTGAKIANLAVTQGKIANLAVTEGKIANLAVDTLKIADRAVTLPNSAFTSSEISVDDNDGLVNVQTLTYTATGQPVNISASCYYYGESDDDTDDDVQLRFRILRGTTLIGAITPINIYRWDFGSQKSVAPFAISVIDTPPAGSVTYKLVADVPSVQNNPNCKVGNRSLVTLEVKK